LVGFSLFNLLLLDAKLLTDAMSRMRGKHAAIVADQDFGDAIGSDRLVEDSKKGFRILPQRDGRGLPSSIS
jgi:hypothetical protein